MMDLTSDQQRALDLIRAWWEWQEDSPFFFLAGKGGTGKTTLASIVAREIRDVIGAAPTGKAASRLAETGLRTSTIHSLIYYPIEKTDPVEWGLAAGKRLKAASLLILDECAMVDEKTFSDLLSFGTRILAMGDRRQLPPVSGEPFFQSREPDFELTEIMRQATDSPIRRFADGLLVGRDPKRFRDESGRVLVLQSTDALKFLTRADQVICGMHATRRRLNEIIRAQLGCVGLPQPGEKLVCLRNHGRFLNGATWFVDEVLPAGRPGTVRLAIRDQSGEQAKVRVDERLFTTPLGADEATGALIKASPDAFTWGYATTCHKAQGSEWRKVIVVDAPPPSEDRAPWLYTAATRAIEKLIFVTDTEAFDST